MALAPCGDLSDLYPTAAGVQCYLPVVSITNNKTNTSTGTYTPTLSATFTDTEGNTTYVGSTEPQTLYSQNYENVTDASAGWTNSGAPISLGTGDATYGQYFYVNTGSTNTRYAYTRLNVDASSCNTYTVEFDLAIKPSNKESMEFCVMSKGGINPSNSWDNYAYINGNANMLFDITSVGTTTEYTVNGSSTTTILDSDKWYHYTLTVNKDSRLVTWAISNGSSGTFNLPEGTSAEFDGFYLVAARYYSTLKLDNILIKSVDDLSSYAFSRPGTLTVTASLNGFESKSASYMVDKPYKILKETPAYNEIQAADAATVLGSNFSSGSFTSRWAYWNSANTYYFVNSGKDSGYLDDASILNFTRNGSATFHLVEGYGIGHNNVNANTIITASNLGDANTIVYYKADLSRGGATNYDEDYAHANDDGTWTYSLYQNCTFCKFIAYVPLSYLRGDLNHDGLVNIVDVTILTNYILGKDLTTTNTREADLNNDENVDVNDIVVLTNIILKKE